MLRKLMNPFWKPELHERWLKQSRLSLDRRVRYLLERVW